MINHKIAIIVPTINRANYIFYLLRTYKYLNQFVGIFIGDGSSKNISNEIKHEFEGGDNLLQIKYYHLPKLHVHHVQRFLMERASELGFTKAVFCGDDDFINPSMLYKCADFLDKNLDYASAQGAAYLGPHPHDNIKSTLPVLANYWGMPNDSNGSSVQRVCNLLNSYWVPHFSLKRTDDYLKILSQSYLDMIDHGWGEVLQSANTLALGKSAYLDGIYMIRGLHNNRALNSRLRWMTSPVWSNQLDIFRSEMRKIANKDVEYELMLDSAIEKYVLGVIASIIYKEQKKPTIFEMCSSKFKFFLRQKLPHLEDIYRFYVSAKNSNNVYLNTKKISIDDYAFISTVYLENLK
jgi:glycosyltransferase domain-containing protein